MRGDCVCDVNTFDLGEGKDFADFVSCQVVTDGSADAMVNSGAAFYVAQASGPATWSKRAAFESMDVTLSWANVKETQQRCGR